VRGGRWGLGGLVAVIMVLAMPVVAHATAPVQAGAGDQPDAVTSRDGTTFLVWEQYNGQPGDVLMNPHDPRFGAKNPDTVGFCRIPRGTTACTDTKYLVSPGCHKQDRPDGTGSSDPGDRPHVQITPFGEVFVTTHGFCFDKPSQFDPPTDYTYVFTSTDDGVTFDAGANLGARPPISAPLDYDTASVFDAADRRVVTLLATNSGAGGAELGLYVQGAALGTQTNSWLKLAPDAESFPYVVQTGKGQFIVAWRSVNGLFVRGFDCEACTLAQFTDPQRWSPPVQIDADGAPGEQSLVSGPSGAFLIYRDGNSDAGYNIGRYYSRKLTLSQPGTTPALAVGDRNPVTEPGPDTSGGYGRAFEDPGTGRIHFVERGSYEDATGTAQQAWDYRTSDDGVAWSTPTHLQPADPETPDLHVPVQLTAATGDDGFTGLLLESGDGVALPFYLNPLPGSGGPPVVTPPGGGTPPGGTPPGTTPGGATTPAGATTEACRVFQFGPVDVKADACLTRDGTTFVAKGAVHVNGLTIAGAEVRFDPVARTVKSVGAVDLLAGTAKFFHGSIDWQLPKGNTLDLGSFDMEQFGAKLEGFPLAGSADVKLVRGAVEIPITVKMPKLLGGITAAVTLRADNLAGVHLRELKLSIGDAPLGPLELKNVEFSYNPDDDAWAGGGTIILPPQPPGPSLGASVGFSQGSLDFLKGELTFPGEGIPLEPTNIVHLTKIRFALEVKPDLKLAGGITLTAGPKFGEVHIASIDGDLSFTFPDGRPAILRADGSVNLLEKINVATAFIQYETDGHVSFGGKVHYDIGPLAFDAGVDGWFYKSAFDIEGSAQVCAGDYACVGGHALISSSGFAVCANLAIADVGVGAHWSPILFTPAFFAGLHIMVTGCDVGPYRAAASSASVARVNAHAAGAGAFTIRPGLPSAFVGVTGADGPPQVALVGPGGQRIVAPATGGLKAKSAVVLHAVQDKTTWFVLGKPSAGAWHVEVLPGSTPVVGVKQADGLPKPVVHAHVSGKGRARLVSYDVTPLAGQQVTFAEVGRGAARPIGPARGPKGTLRFKPADGPAGTRKIVALVTSYGTPRASLVVAHYQAPGPELPATPAGLKLQRTGSRLVVSWRPARLASRYRVQVKLSDARSLIFFVGHGRPRRVVVSAVAKTTSALVTVRGEGANGYSSARATARLTAPKKPAGRTKTKHG